MKNFLVPLVSFLILGHISSADAEMDKNEIKKQILSLAKSFEGQGDPDFSKQKALEPLVEKLLAISPQPSIEKRIETLAGAWRQVWGPYDYRNNDRGVDPELGTEEIYQVVNPGGYYYNVSYLYKNGDRDKKRIGLLRGVYTVEGREGRDGINSNNLKVQFTDYPGASSKQDSVELWQLAELAENETLPNRITIVPSFVVRLFFGGGRLREVYTDEDLRITYGSGDKKPENESIYVMTRVQPKILKE